MKKVVFTALLLINSFLLSGCWNYKEIEQLAIVAGVAVDKSEDEKLKITSEIVSISAGEKGGEIKPQYIEMEGDTFFDASRRTVILSGKRLYWGHAKVIILSTDIADGEARRVLDFVIRDPETREDMWVIVSREKTAKELLESKPITEKIVSFEVDRMLRSQKSVSRYPSVEIYRFVNRLAGYKEAAFLPFAKLSQANGQNTLRMSGTAIFAGNRIAGWLNEMESKTLLLVRDELRGGLYIIENAAGTDTNVSLEIYRNKTDVKAVVSDRNIEFDINIRPQVYIAEIEGGADFINLEGRTVLKREAENRIRKDVEKFIKKVQEEYRTDVFGFGRKLEVYNPNVWNSIKGRWKDIFPDVKTNINVDVEIRGSATRRKPIVTGE